MRTNYVLIDFENVQPESLGLLVQDYFKLLVFVGANQTKLPTLTVLDIHRLSTRADYVVISGSGPNALDFHIAFYIGQLAATEPSAYFHIISKDSGFDPLIEHLKSRKILASRVKAIADIPCLKISNAESPVERLQMILGKLQGLKTAKPGTVKTLTSTISSLFKKQLSEEEIASLIQGLASQGQVTITGPKVTYPSEGDN